VIAFAKTLGLQVTAEGIETAEQLEQLRALGCDHGQGYYFAKPLQPASVQPFLDTHQSRPRPAGTGTRTISSPLGVKDR
jgi:EAL domain-containing protein (putative c-di-GMP-specific phosphodiesterase class I)